MQGEGEEKPAEGDFSQNSHCISFLGGQTQNLRNCFNMREGGSRACNVHGGGGIDQTGNVMTLPNTPNIPNTPMANFFRTGGGINSIFLFYYCQACVRDILVSGEEGAKEKVEDVENAGES